MEAQPRKVKQKQNYLTVATKVFEAAKMELDLNTDGIFVHPALPALASDLFTGCLFGVPSIILSMSTQSTSLAQRIGLVLKAELKRVPRCPLIWGSTFFW